MYHCHRSPVYSGDLHICNEDADHTQQTESGIRNQALLRQIRQRCMYDIIVFSSYGGNLALETTRQGV